MKRIFAICLVISIICFAFSACSKPNGIKDDDKSNVSDITEGVGDAVLDVDDIFGNNSDSSGGTDASGDTNSSEGQSSGSEQSESSSSNSSSEDVNSSDESSSSENSSENVNSNSSGSSSKIDYEDPNVWTKPVGGQ